MGLVVDNFAGGGGASTGIEAALGRPVDVAINHDPEAVAMHAANHPATRHYCQSVWRADPLEVTGGQPVELAWFSPDCKHFSKAKGGKPVEKNIRDLAWVVVLWAKRVRPSIIMLENVEEFRTWGPLNADGMPCPDRRGQTFDAWTRELRKLGYKVEWRELRACDYGAPTSRKRLFLIARCDGLPIVWPKPTHGPGLIPYRTAASIIDWSVPCPSIFERERPLTDNTCRRIAAGIVRYVINAAEPFIVPITHHGDARVHAMGEPLRTVTTAARGELAFVAPTLVQTGYGEREGQAPRALDLQEPLGTVVAGGCKHALVAAFMAQHYTGQVGRPAEVPVSTIVHRGTQQQVVVAHLEQANTGMVGHDMREPVSTIVGKGCTQRLVTSSLVKLRNNCVGQAADEPIDTITAGGGRGGGHFGEVRAFLVKYYGNEVDGHGLAAPIGTVTTRDRFGLVTVNIGGEEYAIADIGMRMLTPRELFRAQGFPDSYIIDPMVDGRPLTKTAQIRMCGNSVCPPLSEALVRANVPSARLAVAA